MYVASSSPGKDGKGGEGGTGKRRGGREREGWELDEEEEGRGGREDSTFI